MNKGDVKATVIMVISISVGIILGYYIEEYYQGKDEFVVILGLVFAILFLLLLMAIWQLIRLHIED